MRMMTSPGAESMSVIHGSAATQEETHVRETEASSATQAEAPRPNDRDFSKKKKFTKSSKNWMSSDEGKGKGKENLLDVVPIFIDVNVSSTTDGARNSIRPEFIYLRVWA